MTTTFQKKARCGVCGSEAKYTVIGSTNAFGSPDLDTRPPEMQRSTIFAGVQCCPECGYCAFDVSNAPSHVGAVVHSQEYTRQLIDDAYPQLANRFLCKACIDETSGDYVAAAWALVHAAWACDDEEKAESARTCRAKAADMISKAISNGQQFAKKGGAETAIQVDLLRRAGRAAEARKLMAERSSTITEGVVSKMLAFQEDLLFRGDEACHTIAEAVGENQ